MSSRETAHYQAMLAAIIDSSDDAIISKDLNGIITSWNDAASRIFGYTEQEMIGRHISVLIPPDRLEEENMILSRLRAGNRIQHFETIRQRRDGTPIFVSITVSPIKNKAGEITGASKIARDITAQVEAKKLLQEYAERLEMVNAVSKDIASDLNAESILQKITDATTKVSGAAFGAFFYNQKDAKGNAYKLVKLSGAPMEAFAKFGMPRDTNVFKPTFNGEGIVRSDDITKDPRYGLNRPLSGMPEGHLPVVSYLAVPVISQKGIVLGGILLGHPKAAVFKEEHERLVLAIALQGTIALENAKLYEEVQLLNAQKDEFIGFASHELKTPLTTAMGYVQLLEDMPEKQDEFIPKVKKQMKRLSSIIADLLDITKIQGGRLELDFKKSSLQHLVYNSVEALGDQAKTHCIHVEVPQEEIFVNIDRVKMEQVLINLLSNAIKYSPGAVQVKLVAKQVGDEIIISVRDYGKGIPVEHMDKIFNRFYRVSQPFNKTEGLGLGLYICQGIADAHAGKIWAENFPGEGAAFHVSFPVNNT